MGQFVFEGLAGRAYLTPTRDNKIYVDALELEVRVAVVGTGGVDAVLVGDDFPELGTDLVAALAALDVDEFTHDLSRRSTRSEKEYENGGARRTRQRSTSSRTTHLVWRALASWLVALFYGRSLNKKKSLL